MARQPSLRLSWGGEVNEGIHNIIGARVDVRPSADPEAQLPACKKTFPFRLTLETADVQGKSSAFEKTWPCKWKLSG